MKKIQLGIIGTGVAAKLLHWPALEQLEDRYEIRAVANRTVSKAEDFAQLVGLDKENVYGDYRSLLERADIDTVILAVPPEFNVEIATAAFEAGKNVICEKPIAASLADAQKMASLPEKYKKILLIAENFRYERAIAQTRELLDEGVISTPFMMMYKWMQHVPEDDEIAGRPWRQDSGLPGGFFSDHGIHMMDVVRFLLGEIYDLQVYGRELAEHVAGVDTALYNIRCSSGAVCSVQWSFAAPENELSYLELWARDGHLKVRMDRIEIHKGGKVETIDLKGEKSSFYYEFLDFYDVIVHGKQPLMSVKDGVRDLLTVQRAYDSFYKKTILAIHEEEHR